MGWKKNKGVKSTQQELCSWWTLLSCGWKQQQFSPGLVPPPLTPQIFSIAQNILKTFQTPAALQHCETDTKPTWPRATEADVKIKQAGYFWSMSKTKTHMSWKDAGTTARACGPGQRGRPRGPAVAPSSTETATKLLNSWQSSGYTGAAALP